MPDFVHKWEYEGEVITFTWLGDADVEPDRVYAFAFTQNGRMLLVTDPNWRPACWLPGGGIEDGERPEQALARELIEEAGATVVKCVKIGSQSAVDSRGMSYQAFYWCRIAVASEFSPMHEVTDRYLVTPDEFLDRLFWGRRDPKAPMLLERALEIEKGERNHHPVG